MMRKQISSAKSSIKSYGSCVALSPYEPNYKGCLRAEQRELIFEHQRVTKMTRRDLEDQYINLCDEHYATKRENRCNQEKIKQLLTKISRLTSLSQTEVRAALNTNLIHRSRNMLSFEEKLQICIFDLELQNSQLSEKLRTLCKRHGLPNPILTHPCSERSTNPHGRAQSCTSLNVIATEQRKREDLDDIKPLKDNESPSSHHLPEKDQEKCKNEQLEEKNRRLGKLLAEFNEQLEIERNRNRDALCKIKELEVRKHISENIELINTKEMLENAQQEFRKRLEQFETTKARLEQLLVEEKLTNVALNQKLLEEQQKLTIFNRQSSQVDELRKQIGDLREQLIESESEKQSLKTQHERFALLLKESVLQGDRIQTLKEKISLLQLQLDEAKSNEMAVTHSKTELMEKIIIIQDENDRISIELEGLRSLLAQDNEYKLRKEVDAKHIETKVNLQDMDLREGQPRRNLKEIPTKMIQTPTKSVGVNTHPRPARRSASKIRIDTNSDLNMSSESESLLNSGMDNNVSFYDEPLTLESERPLIKASTKEVYKKEGQRNKDNLELLERAALYGTYSRPTTANNNYSNYKFEQPDSLCDSSGVFGVYQNHLTLTLQSFEFLHTPKDSTYFLEVTMSSREPPFYSTGFSGRSVVIKSQGKLKLEKNGTNLLEMAKTDTPVRFLLLEKNTLQNQLLRSSSSSSSPDETLSAAATNFIQCREVAFGSLQYTTLLKSIEDPTALANTWSAVCKVPIYATDFSHEEIGHLSVCFEIDDVFQMRQLLTNRMEA